MPRVVICVCTCARPHLLRHLLSVMERLEPGGADPAELALLVVDNRPDGAARAVCEAARERLPFPLAYAEEPEPGISFARNRALAEAMAMGAELVAFVDDDDEPRPDWLHHLLRTRQETGADMVFGTWHHPETLRPPRHLARVRFFDPIRLGDRNSYGLPGWAGTYNVMLSRRLVEALAAQGPVFRPEFALTGGGDTDMFIRAHRAGFAYAAATDSVVYRVWEPERMTLRGLMRRAFRIGCTRMQLAAAHEPPDRVRKIYRRSLVKLVQSLAKLPPRVGRPSALAVHLVRVSEHAGEVYAASGRRFVYYGSQAGLSVARAGR
jgi:GT2 family glycosyltransferase